MVPIAELKRIAAKNGISLSVVEKDYALTWILYAFGKSNYKKNLIFKGGTALRKVYFEDWRYSEDLDFTVTSKYTSDELKKVVGEINAILSDETAMTIALKSLHQNPDYAQLKIQFLGPLNQKNTIKCDLSFNELIVLEPGKKLILSEYSDKNVGSVFVYPLEEILAEKMRSIVQRGKSRDYYDVWRLLKFHDVQIDKQKALQALSKKCQWKNVVCDEATIFSKEKLDNAQLRWEKGLSYQISNLPSFKTASAELKILIKKFLHD